MCGGSPTGSGTATASPSPCPFSHGKALTYPYAFLPWTVAAFMWPVLGERAVTTMLVLGCISLIATTAWALPELRAGGWLMVAVLANPGLVSVAIIGQLPFAWAAALLWLAIGLWRRDRWRGATIAAGLAGITHPAVIMPIVLALAAVTYWRTRDRRLLTAYLGSAVIALPAAVLVVRSPVFSDTTLAVKLVQFVGTVLPRAAVVVVPAGLAWLARRRPRALVHPAIAAALLLANLALVPIDTRTGWIGLRLDPEQRAVGIINSNEFRPGLTYRILRTDDRKVTMYTVVRHGGHLDSEFFPESMAITNFRSARQYSQFLAGRSVDVAVDYRSYDRKYRTNEHAVLASLAANSPTCSSGLVGVTRFHHEATWDGYRIARKCIAP